MEKTRIAIKGKDDKKGHSDAGYRLKSQKKGMDEHWKDNEHADEEHRWR